MNLMFTLAKEYEAKMPGFITVPFKFKLEELEKFVN